MVFYDRYNDLLYFDSPSVNLLISILFAILDHNYQISKEEDQQFLCFFKPLLEKQAATTLFQQMYRAKLFRSKLQKLPIDLIIRMTATLCI